MRHSAHVATTTYPDEFTRIHAAFAACQTFKLSNIHCNALPPPTTYLVEMKKHPYAEGFMEAAQVDLNSLMEKGTYKWVPATCATG
jgi:hypothetical protein